MFFGVRHIGESVILLLAWALQLLILEPLLPEKWRESPWIRSVPRLIIVLLMVGIVLNLGVILHRIEPNAFSWIRGVALAVGLSLIGGGIVACLTRPLEGLLAMEDPRVSPERRRWMKAGVAAAAAAPLAVVGFGMFVERNRFRLSEVNIPMSGLPKDLDGLRIVQLTDIHLGSFLAESTLTEAIDLANETKAHIAVVTGDLITAHGDPVDAAIRQIARLKADAGVLGCHGNHEVYAGVVEYASAETEKRGVRILRQRAESLRFGSSVVNLVGVDYQRMGGNYLQGTMPPEDGDVNVLLSHNPDVFPAAAAKGFHLTLAGHTHGGQINFEILDRNINVTRFFTPYTNGLYREGNSAIYVSAGLGTVGIPVRIGAPPEVALIRLCAT